MSGVVARAADEQPSGCELHRAKIGRRLKAPADEAGEA